MVLRGAYGFAFGGGGTDLGAGGGTLCCTGGGGAVNELLLAGSVFAGRWMGAYGSMAFG